jgi:hypothetical protein
LPNYLVAGAAAAAAAAISFFNTITEIAKQGAYHHHVDLSSVHRESWTLSLTAHNEHALLEQHAAIVFLYNLV